MMKQCNTSSTSSNIDLKLKVSSDRKSRRLSRNSKRRSRRKRSKLRYYTDLKSVRYQRKTDDLCSSIKVIDITDMEWCGSSSTHSDVADWHKQDQISYWKSRALSLEYENRMLLDHLRNIYAKQIQDYADYVNTEIQHEIESSRSSAKNKNETRREKVEMIEPIGKQRRQQMEILYGSNAARIMGMETAVQLNYDLHMENFDSIQEWPCTPLNL